MKWKTLFAVALSVVFAGPATAASSENAPTALDPIEVIGQTWEPPKPKIRFRPAFPMRAKQRWEEGCVVLRYTIREDGQTDDFAIMESNPVGVFEKNVVAAVFKWRFEPTDQARTLVEQFEFRNSRLSTSPVKSVVSYNTFIDEPRHGSASQPMFTTAGYQAPRCEDWDRNHDDGDNGPELVGYPVEAKPTKVRQRRTSGGSAQPPAKRSYR